MAGYKVRVGSLVRTLQLFVSVTLICCLYNVDRLHLDDPHLETPAKLLTVRFHDEDGIASVNGSSKYLVMHVRPTYAIALSPSDIVGFGKDELFNKTQPVLAASIIEFLDVLLVALVAVYGELNDGKTKKWIHVVICMLRVILQLGAFFSLLAHRIQWTSLWTTNTNVSPSYPLNWTWAMVVLGVLGVLTLTELCFYSIYRYSIRLQTPEPEAPKVSIRRYSPVMTFEEGETLGKPQPAGLFSGYRVITSSSQLYASTSS